MREIREAVASLIVPGVFMVSLTLFICYQAVRRITSTAGGAAKELEARTADNLTPIAIHSATPRNRCGGFGIKRSGQSPDQHAG